MNWDHAVNTIIPHIVKIRTPQGHGTGFLAFYNFDKSWCGIATAAHVVDHAEEWQEPVKIMHQASGTTALITTDKRVIIIDRITDSAIVLFLKSDLDLPEFPVALLPMGQPCLIGSDVGWLGFPAIAADTLCFFSGSISAHLETRKAYLIDGVAIHGVSGGPVIHCPSPDDGGVHIIGCVSAYEVNRATGEALPGLLKAQDVSHFHGVISTIRSVDEANAKKREFDAAQAQKATPPPEKPSPQQPELKPPHTPSSN